MTTTWHRAGRLAVFVLLLAAGLATATPGAAAADAIGMRIQRVKSPGGIEAWLIEDHSNPIIALKITFRGGAALDPAGKEGLAEMVSGLLDEGAGELDSQAFQARLDNLSIRLSFNAGLDRFHGSLQTLTETRDEAFRLLGLALNRPRFDAEPVDRIRSQILVNLASQSENPRYIARRRWWRQVFPEHPYGRPVQGSPESVKAIAAADLRAFVGRRLGRDNLLIGVVGDITAKTLGPLLDTTFGGLPAKAAPHGVGETRPRATGKITVVRRSIPQSVVVFGQQGLKRDDPDFYAAYVMNYVLGGGGFNSRLYAEVREKRGLAYSVYSYLNPLSHTGLIVGGVGTQNGRVKESIEIIRDEWRRLAADGAGTRELADAKTYLTGSFPLRFNSTRRIARMLVGIQLEKLGIDYFQRRNEYIDAVTEADIRRVAKRLLDADALTFVVVGDPKGLGSG